MDAELIVDHPINPNRIAEIKQKSQPTAHKCEEGKTVMKPEDTLG